MLAPGASRPICSWFWLHRSSSAFCSGLNASGVNKRTSGLRNENSFGSTPTTVYGTSSSRMFWPTTLSTPPRRSAKE